MHQSDVVIINVKPNSVECPLCGDDITEKNMKNTCSKNIEGHNVCNNCYNGLSQTYYEGGIGCIYCGDVKTKKNTEENIAVISTRPQHNNTHIVVIERSRNNLCNNFSENFCFVFCIVFCLVTIVGSLFMLGCIMYSVGDTILHAINDENHTHKTEFTIRNCVIGYLGWLIVLYITFTTCLLIDSCLSICSCYYEEKCRPNIVKKISNCINSLEKYCMCCSNITEQPRELICQKDCVKTYSCFAGIMAVIFLTCIYTPN